jgi:hypothetical protein
MPRPSSAEKMPERTEVFGWSVRKRLCVRKKNSSSRITLGSKGTLAFSSTAGYMIDERETSGCG